VYAFIYNVNVMRGNVQTFLNQYATWAQSNINQLALQQIPSNIAKVIYGAQENATSTLLGPSDTDFILNILGESALWGVGGAVALATAFFSPLGAIAIAFAASAGANFLSELVGVWTGSSSVRTKIGNVSRQTLTDVATNTETAFASAYSAILDQLNDVGFVQLVCSNYGLLLAIQMLNPAKLFAPDSTPTSPQPYLLAAENSLTVALTKVSWRALVTAVFHWAVVPLPDKTIEEMRQTYVPKNSPYNGSSDQPPSFPAMCSLNKVFSIREDLMPNMLERLQSWQQSTHDTPSGAPFCSVSPFSYSSCSDGGKYQLSAGGMIFPWVLLDETGHLMDPSLIQSLFGIGKQPVTWTAVDANQPFQGAAGGWYWDVLPQPWSPSVSGPITTPYDAFMN